MAWRTAAGGASRGGSDPLGWRRSTTPFDDDRPCYIGSAWFSLSRRGAQTLLSAPDAKRLLRHYRGTIIPDESYFQTLAARSIPEGRIGDNRRYIRFSGGPNPDVLTTEDLPAMLDSGADFARKFDIATDASVLDELDRLHA